MDSGPLPTPAPSYPDSFAQAVDQRCCVMLSVVVVRIPFPAGKCQEGLNWESGRLPFGQPGKQAIFFEQFLVGSRFYNGAFVEDEDPVGIDYGA